MTDTPDQSPQDKPGMDESEIDRERVLAAEFSLGLLEGEELLAARGRMARDPAFAWRRQWWDDWFVPLSDDVAGAEPGEHVWSAISTEIGARAASAQAAQAGLPTADNVALIDMERRVRRWKWTAGIATAAAALALALFAATPGVDPVPEVAPGNAPQMASADAPLMASIPVGDSLRLGVTFLPASEEMLISAAGFSADGVHDHELWLVPEDGGALQSLGVIAPGEERRIAVARDVAANMGDGVELVVTREPIGGKPEGQDAGPVVAQGTFGAV
jgi:anti-sigma-K factor RskA